MSHDLLVGQSVLAIGNPFGLGHILPTGVVSALGREIKALDGKEVTLPGSAEERYLRLPTVALLVLGPIMGLAFAMFLPFIGFALLATQIVRKVAHTIVKSAPEANVATATAPKASVKRESDHHDEPLN
mgnify:CR=1 FL=1